MQHGHRLDEAGTGPLPRGQIAGFREVLFKEHIGVGAFIGRGGGWG
jgi:hypothetical protein